ncbi:MAG: protein translocase subunit SecF [Massiliimalia sp.]
MRERKPVNIDFVGHRKIYFMISAILFAVIILSTFIFGVDLDIRFKGGTILTYSYQGEISNDDVEKAAEDVLNRNVSVEDKFNKLTGENEVSITLVDENSLDTQLQGQLTETLTQQFADYNMKEMEITSVNPNIGREFFLKCMLAVGFGSIFMIVYIGLRFKRIGGWSAGVMAVLALFHDVVVVYGTFILCRLPLDDSFIAVVLTILGYSINNTIVIYDRIRENKVFYAKTKTLGDIVNLSINQTLARSMNTSIATILSMVVVCVVALVCGINSIISFAFPLITGLISGTYSSICIASEAWVSWQMRGDNKSSQAKRTPAKRKA